MIETSLQEAVKMGYKAVVIFGNPANYAARGFKCCKKYNVCLEQDRFPSALLVKELEPGFFDGAKRYFYESPAFAINADDAEAFDKHFEPWEKAVQLSQEVFYILSRSDIRG